MSRTRSYKCDGRIFQGFDKDFSHPHRLVLVQDEDIFNIYAIDGNDITEEMDELLRYFTFTESKAKVIGTYSEEGFRGFLCGDQFVSPLSRFK